MLIWIFDPGQVLWRRIKLLHQLRLYVNAPHRWYILKRNRNAIQADLRAPGVGIQAIASRVTRPVDTAVGACHLWAHAQDEKVQTVGRVVVDFGIGEDELAYVLWVKGAERVHCPVVEASVGNGGELSTKPVEAASPPNDIRGC